MIFKFKDRHGVDPRIIKRRKALGLEALPEIEVSGPEVVYPGRVECPACGERLTTSPYLKKEDALRIHQSGCPRMRREIIVVKRG